jgi:hypothetical protein
MANLLQRAQEARAQIKAANEMLVRIQDACSHPIEVLEVEPVCDDSSSISHYTNHKTCGVCGKFWVEEQ